MRGEQGVEGRGVRARDVVWWGGVLLPMAALLVLMWLYGLDAPYQDSWEFVPVLERSLEGGLGFEALWAQHNVHRIFVPRLIMLGLARCSGWNVRWELGVSLLCAAGTFAGLVWAWRRSMREVPEARGSWMVPFMALMAFSLVQWRIWIWGWLLQISLCQAAVVWALVLLSGQALGWKRVLGAGVFGCVATHSFAAGLMVWPVGFLVGLMCGEAGGRKQWFGLVWGLFSLVGLGSFSAGYALQEGAGGMAPACLGAPGYVCAFLGGAGRAVLCSGGDGGRGGRARSLCGIGRADGAWPGAGVDVFALCGLGALRGWGRADDRVGACGRGAGAGPESAVHGFLGVVLGGLGGAAQDVERRERWARAWGRCRAAFLEGNAHRGGLRGCGMLRFGLGVGRLPCR